MNVEVIGARFTNQGALLMLHAIGEAFARHKPEARLVMGLRQGSAQQRRGIGFGHVAHFGTAKFVHVDPLVTRASRFVPSPLLASMDTIRERDVDVVLDASGFAYGGVWPDSFITTTLRHVERWKRDGTSFIMLPQAFGAFERPTARDAARRLVDHADLVFARDDVSRQHVEALGPERDVHQAPDFTNLLDVSERAAVLETPVRDAVAVIPNLRIVDRADLLDRATYTRQFTSLVRHLQASKQRVVLVAHERNDAELVRDVASTANALMIIEPDALKLKAHLATARLVISSRFHGLVNGLTQAVPVIALGWSHKYQALLEDYACGDCLVHGLEDEETRDVIQRELDPKTQRWRRDQLRESSAAWKRKTEAMWNDVFNCIHR